MICKIKAPFAGRIDKVLAQALGQSRNQISHLIDANCVKVGGVLVKKSSFKVKKEEEIEYFFLEKKENSTFKDIDFEIEILYEDEDILVINKPSNLVVHPAPSVKEATLLDWLKAKGISLSTIYGEERFGIVHRIDKDTTGALVVAKNNESHKILAEELKTKKMGRYYIALIDYPLKENLSINRPIARNPKNRLKMGIVAGGKEAKTDFIKLEEGKNNIELIAARLHTGRTHQIRVHLSSINRHILGDTLYGYKGKDISRIFLHARFLYLTHPKTKKAIQIEAPLFEDMRSFIEDNFTRRVLDEKISGENLHNTFINYFGAL
jgi:23S rRNA pseudouridine1911/1915/1917 synthase